MGAKQILKKKEKKEGKSKYPSSDDKKTEQHYQI